FDIDVRPAPQQRWSRCEVSGGRGSRNRTYNLRFWRPTLCQLSYTPVILQGDCKTTNTLADARKHLAVGHYSTYLLILETTPAPTVRPPSRIAKRRPSSIAIGEISFTSMATLSPGKTISLSA